MPLPKNIEELPELPTKPQRTGTNVSTMSGMSPSHTQRVLVAVRVRPPTVARTTSPKTMKPLPYEPATTCLTFDTSTVKIAWPTNTPVTQRISTPTSARTTPKEFKYDSVLAWEEPQSAVHDKIVEPLIKKCLEGYNGCIFCYGQTASGKTYTMEGPRLGPDGEPPFDPANKDTGIILRVANQIMQHIGIMGKEKPELEYFVRVSYLEIYNEGLRDLLVAENEQGDLRIRQDPESANGQDLVVSGITERSIETIHDYIKILQTGSRNRKVGETNMNEKSSRSHAVMTIILEERVKPSGDMSPEEADMLAKHGRKRSKIHLIDLAGSERANATGATGDRLREGAQINLSLSSLGNVINALTTGAKHVPYRDSKLTYLLSDSLGGNSLTLMITCVTPTLSNYDETLSTLRFAERVKKVRNVAKVNVDPTMMRILALEAEVRELKELLAKCTCGAVQQARAKMVSVGAGSGDWNAGADAWTMSDSAALTDKATNTSKKLPWWKRMFACCSGKSEPRGDRKTQLMRKIFPAEKIRSAPMTDDDERGEGLMKSMMGKLTFS